MESHYFGRFSRWGSPAAVLAAALAFGLSGLRWGLPGQGRLERVLPPGLHGRAFHETLESSWKDLHARLGENLMLNPESFGTFSGLVELDAGWKTPPKELLNAVRSFHVRSVHDDEQTLLLALSKMKPRSLRFNPHFFAYGGAYIYSLGAWLAAGALAGAVTLKTSMGPYLDDPSAMGGLYAWGRLLSVLAYAGAGLLLVEMGRRLRDSGAGLAAGLLFIFSPGPLIQAHTMKPHMFWSFFALLTLFLCFRIIEKGGLRAYLAAGAASGAAVGAAFNAWPSCLLVAAAAGLRAVAEPNETRREAGYLAAAGGASLGVFLLTNPYWALDFKRAYGEFAVISEFAALSAANPFVLLLEPVRRSATAPWLFAMAAGAVYGLGRIKKEPVLALCVFAFALFASAAVSTAGVAGTRQIRYFLPLLGAGFLLASVLLRDLISSGRGYGKLAAAAALAAGLNLAVQGVLYARNFVLTAGERSNHHLAGDWINANVPEGASLGVLREPAPSNSAYFRLDRVRLRLIEPAVFNRLPEEKYPEFLAVTCPDYDERPGLEPGLGRVYARVARFERARFLWASVDPTSTTANPLIEIYRRKGTGS